MQYSKPMIDLVYEIRRRVDPATKPGVKLANPDMPQELADYYLRSKDVVTKALIKELFFLAGDEWIELIEGKAQPLPKQAVKVYRGQVSLVDAPVSAAQMDAPPVPPKPQRIYRGQVVDY
jgi:hypothetical protein